MSESPESVLEPGTRLGRYSLVRILGRGGMGAVYEGLHEELGKRVAIKTLHAHYAESKDVRARFLREGQAAAKINHPHVVEVHDVAADGKVPYLVMQFLEGEDLRGLLKREGLVSAQRIADILVPVVCALAAAHDLGIVHRDLKPENIFLSIERGVVRPKVVDFGISKVIDSSTANALTGTATLLGTPYYMSPEQARGAKHVDARTDQYALGVILYEALTGRRPFEEESLFALMSKIVAGDFEPPRAWSPAIPAELEAIVLRAMAMDAEARFPTTLAFGLELIRFASANIHALYLQELSRSPSSYPISVPTSSGGTANTMEAASTISSTAHDVVQRLPTRSNKPVVLGLAATATLVVGGVWFGVSRWASDRDGVEGAGDTPVVASQVPAAADDRSLPSPTTPSPLQLAADPHVIRRLQSAPPGASVVVGGAVVGTTPHDLQIAGPGEVEVSLVHEGFRPLSLNVSPNGTADVMVEMERVAKPAPKKNASRPGAAQPPKNDRPTLAPR